MKVQPEIEALRSDPASQRRCSEAMKASLAAWYDLPEVVGIRSDLAAYSSSGDLDDCGGLRALMSDHSAAQHFVATVCGQFIKTLCEEPLAEVPFRRSSGEGFSRVQLMQSGGAVLSICAFEPDAWAGEPETVQFVDCSAHEIVIAGSAHGRFYERDRGTMKHMDCHWHPGDQIVRRPNLDARHVLRVEQSLLTLQLTRVSQQPGPSCEYQLSDGALVRMSSGDKRASEQVMALAVLGAIGAEDTAEPIAEFARNCGHDADARWEACRQLLALDTQAGFALIYELSRRSDDPIADPSRSLCARLAETHPALRTHQEEIA